MLNELIERLEKATGPDVALDHAIAFALGDNFRASWKPEVTGDLNRAIQLVPKGMSWIIATEVILLTKDRNGAESKNCCAMVIDGASGPYIDLQHAEFAPTTALALCIAALKARQAQED